jgi:uncharacterized protein (DUF3820 family)
VEFEKSETDSLRRLAEAKMPFGKYAGRYLSDIPEPYFIWFATKGYPPGDLGEMMKAVFEIKVNGLEYLLRRVRNLESGGSGYGGA